MYKILLDQNKLFECQIRIEGADSDKTQARLMVETENFTICFKGKVANGKVEIPIGKLKNILKENSRGNIFLEVIAEDTFFTPWRETYETDVQRKVEVTFSDKPVITESKKPKVTVVDKSDVEKHADNILSLLEKKNVTLRQISKDPKIVTEMMSHYLVKTKVPIEGNMEKIENILEILMEKVTCLK